MVFTYSLLQVVFFVAFFIILPFVVSRYIYGKFEKDEAKIKNVRNAGFFASSVIIVIFIFSGIKSDNKDARYAVTFDADVRAIPEQRYSELPNKESVKDSFKGNLKYEE